MWKLEKAWSCPIHDGPVTHKWIYEEDWNDESTICLDCLFGEWQVIKDEGGWATMTFRLKTPMDKIFEEMRNNLVADMNRTTYGDHGILGELQGRKVVIEWES